MEWSLLGCLPDLDLVYSISIARQINSSDFNPKFRRGLDSADVPYQRQVTHQVKGVLMWKDL